MRCILPEVNLSTEAHQLTDETPAADSVVYVLTGRRRWWSDRRFKLAVTIALIIGLILGAVITWGALIFHGHSVLVEASSLYKDLIDRGDAAIALLANVRSEIERTASGSGKNRVLLASDLDTIKRTLDSARATTEGIAIIGR